MIVIKNLDYVIGTDNKLEFDENGEMESYISVQLENWLAQQGFHAQVGTFGGEPETEVEREEPEVVPDTVPELDIPKLEVKEVEENVEEPKKAAKAEPSRELPKKPEKKGLFGKSKKQKVEIDEYEAKILEEIRSGA